MEIIKDKKILFSAVFSAFFSFFLAIGDNYERYRELFVIKTSSVFVLTVAFLISFLFTFVFLKYKNKVEKYIFNMKLNSKITDLFFQPNKKCFWNCFLFIAVCHLPVFLAFFPGLFNYDTYYQIGFFVNHDYIETHPLIHNLAIYAVWLISKAFNTDWGGVFIYTIIQSTVVITIYAYCIVFLSKYNTAYALRLFSLLFFALYLPNQIMHLIATKDVIFSSLIMLMVMYLFDFFSDRKNFLSRNKKIIFFITVSGILLLRHNAIWAYMICLPFFIYLFRKENKKNLMLFIYPVIVFYLLVPVKFMFGIAPAQKANIFCIPLQQMARVELLYENELSNEDKNLFKTLFSKKAYRLYDPFTADPIKGDYYDNPKLQLHSDHIEKVLNANSKIYINLYLKWFKKYPKEYIEAFLLNTYKYWNIRANYNYIIYPGCYIITDNAWENFYGVKIKIHSLIPQLKCIIKEWVDNNYCLQGSSAIFYALAYNTWFLIFCFLLLFYEKKYDLIIILSLIPALFLTVLFGPVAILRYIWQNYQILPIILAFCVGTIRYKSE